MEKITTVKELRKAISHLSDDTIVAGTIADANNVQTGNLWPVFLGPYPGDERTMLITVKANQPDQRPEA
jgi:hypothetical protein